MKLIKSSAEFLPQAEGLEGIYKQVEIAGRTCYKSEDKITEDSAKGFVDRMIASHHTAMLEHGTVYLLFANTRDDNEYFVKYNDNPYSVAIYDKLGYVYVTTNYRVLVENKWLKDLKFICEPTPYHQKRYTFKFICDRGVSHELVRHRRLSFAQESTRYCNYSRSKWGSEITFIQPSWYTEAEPVIKSSFESFLKYSEDAYMDLIDHQYTAQQARQVLPNALKTEIVVTGFAFDWRYFFDLRMWGKTGAPHPDMKELATKAMLAAQDAGIWMSIEKQPSQFEK